MRKLLLLTLLFISQQSFAATYYATPGGGAAASCVDATTNVCTLSRAVTVAANGDTINLAAGTYVGTELGASGYVLMTSKLINLTCAGTRTCILQPSVATAGIRLNTPPDNGTITITGIVVDGLNGTSPNYCFLAGDDATGIYTVNITDSTCKNPVFYGVYAAATSLNLTLTNLNVTGTSAGHARSFLFTDRTIQWIAGTITITGGSAQLDSQNTGASAVINIEAFAAGLTASVTGWAGTITLDPTLTSTGEHSCIQLLNVANSTIQDSSCSVYGNVGSRTSALFRINSCGNTAGQGCVGTETPRAITTALIKNVTGTNGTTGGYGAIIGQDATSSADNQITNALIQNANISCNVPGTTTHGVMLGYLVGGRTISSKVDSCGINYIAKKTSTTSTIFSGNTSKNPTSQHFRAKGAVATWLNNTAYSSSGSGDLFYADQETISVTNSTVSLYNNASLVSGGTPTYNVYVATSSTLTAASNNNWYGLLNWSNAGSTYSTVETWNADGAVGTDLNVNPGFIGKFTPSSESMYYLTPSSNLRRAGKDINIGNVQDRNNRAFSHPPSIGAYEVTSGVEASTRTDRN